MKRSSPPSSLSLKWARDAGFADRLVDQLETELRARRRRRRAIGGTAAGLCLLLFVGLWAVPTYRHTDTLTTPAARRQIVALSDGSSAELNARTSISTDFRYGRRSIEMTEGEAFFTVAKDASHPFIVRTARGNIRVTGTAFNVRVTPELTEVTLLEGSVSFENTGASKDLIPGEQLTSLPESAVESHKLDRSAIARVTAWRQGRLVLDGLTLGQAAERLAAYHGVTITPAAEVSTLTPGGTFPLDDLDAFFEALETILPVKVLRRDEGRYALIAR